MIDAKQLQIRLIKYMPLLEFMMEIDIYVKVNNIVISKLAKTKTN